MKTLLILSLVWTQVGLAIEWDVAATKKFIAASRAESLALLSLKELDELGLSSGQSTLIPWTDTYWPLYKGLTAYPYAGVLGGALSDSPDENYRTFKKNRKILREKLYSAKGLTDLELAGLSPAEKYDLLVGDWDFTLTESQWKWARKTGNVEAWNGLCHGWAAASIAFPRPKHRIDLLAAGGAPRLDATGVTAHLGAANKKITIPFFPSDIKALGSLLWAETPSREHIVQLGLRCGQDEIKRDKRNRILNPACFDVNPAEFHYALIYVMGMQKQSFVLDAGLNYQVWNQPIRSYSMEYYNPKSSSRAKTSVAAMAKIEDLRKRDHRFLGYFSAATKFVVGVVTRVRITLERPPNHFVPDSDRQDRVQQLEFHYLLELDEAGQVIGGEWDDTVKGTHPDFIWTIHHQPHATTLVEQHDLLFASGSLPDLALGIPSAWLFKAQESSKNDLPLSAVVDFLFMKSSGLTARP